MAIKKLQNNFTSPEQSKRLLELGVPADSADCYYLAIGHEPKKYGYSDFPYFITTNKADLAYLTNPNIPCWSVGRLIEIMMICTDENTIDFMTPILCEDKCIRLGYEKYRDILNSEEGVIEAMIQDISTYKERGLIDFSKLEE